MEKNYIKNLLFLSISLFILALGISTFQITTNIVYSQASPNKANLKIQDLSITNSPTGIAEIKGNVFNNNTSNVDDIIIHMTFYDKAGKQIDTFDRYATEPSFVLKPGGSHAFNYLEVVSFYRISGSNVTASADIVK
jgi:hypothetical protein